MADYGIVPGTGALGLDWPDNHTLPQGKRGAISSAGWTEGNEGFPQQTFLGASLRTFSVSAGFGDSTSTLSVDVVNDEYNKSDQLGIGSGDDVYHNGIQDTFRPPVVGTPVFFKFGKNFATIEQAFRKTFDTLYNKTTIPPNIDFPTYTTNGEITTAPANHYLRSFVGAGATQVNTWVDKSSLLDHTNPYRGKDHFAFGGILQSYTENRTTESGPLYSLQVSDPREILTNAVVLLNNYQGTTYNNKNLFNAYGFLEYDVSDDLLEDLEGTPAIGTTGDPNYIAAMPNPDLISKDILTKEVDNTGNITYIGDDTYNFNVRPFGIDNLPAVLPITGQGFSRRGDQGIPWYRVNQALTAMFNYDGTLPKEYVDAGFGGTIDFRGYKYVVDFSGIPLDKIPKMYFMNFDQLDMLALAQELCDVISHDLFVSLLPVINHPNVQWLYDYNQYQIQQGNNTNVITGIIRVDAIDRSKQPEYGAIKSYLDNLTQRGIEIQNRDIGFELSNVTTDKFVVGAQEVHMYYFTNNKDRNNTQLRRKTDGLPNDHELLEEEQWNLKTSLKQQILPFYGFLGENAVTIPRGFGSYQQIMLDTTALNAFGVGNYYIATELELRMALKGYKDWADLLASYDEIYIEDIAEDKEFYKALQSAPDFSDAVALSDIFDKSRQKRQAAIDQCVISSIDFPFAGTDFANVVEYCEFTYDPHGDYGADAITKLQNGKYAVTVPRCVFNSDRNFMGDDGYPASPCAPPYGYPLYYKRAEKIGIPQGGAASFVNAQTNISTNNEELQKRLKKKLGNEAAQWNDDKLVEKTNAKIRDLVKDENLFYDNTSAAFGGFRTLRYLNKDQEKELEVITDLMAELQGLLEGVISIKNVTDDNTKLIKQIKELGLDGVANSKKVYEFIKGVAEENLGKKFLVKIPKACNLKYSEQISHTQPPPSFQPLLPSNQANHGWDIEGGPFGFKPQPINSDTTYTNSSVFSTEINGLLVQNLAGDREIFSHYLDADAKGKYTYGALKGNFNPISEKWDFNYQPSTQGGFFDFALFDRNLSFTESSSLEDSELPPGTQQQLIPKDLSNFVSDGRIKCFARYDHSEWLDLSSVSKNSLTQQKIVAGAMVPDILEELDNTNPNPSKGATLDRIGEIQGGQELPPSVAFVACEIDEKLYMAPKTHTSGVFVYGRKTKFVPNALPPLPDGKKMKFQELLPIFTLAENGGTDGTNVDNVDFKRIYNQGLNAYIVDTEKQNLDSEHVYALVTVPGRIKPTVESRYLDGVAYTQNPHKIKHSMTQDVTRGPAGFDKPPPAVIKETPVMKVDCNDVPKVISTLSYAQKQQAIAVDNAGKGSRNPVVVAQSQPSPVYPDIVAIPLMSMERCYGPWRSATTNSILAGNNNPRDKFSDIGGKIEFLKDENIAPWNYAGYQLMNEAGKLQAEFSNSLLLFSERGGFAIPEAPTGVSLATALKSGGPLVTSINVDIGDSISTTIKMDLYTSRFGKLQKQKELAIAGISRERQKIIDRNNKAIRTGLGKASTGRDFLAPIRGIGEALERVAESTSNSVQNHIELVSKQNDAVAADGTRVGKQTIVANTVDQTNVPQGGAGQNPYGPTTATSVPITDVVMVSDNHARRSNGFPNMLHANEGLQEDINSPATGEE